MGVIVNKARRHDQPGCVDFLAAGAKHAADIGDLAVLDRDVADCPSSGHLAQMVAQRRGDRASSGVDV
jgi:hypothetical protein